MIPRTLLAFREADRKAHPDEKGTERAKSDFVILLYSIYRKAHPDEKGTESCMAPVKSISSPQDRKAHPDEKGTESCSFLIITFRRYIIARPIPMKRELKVHMFLS